MNHRNTALVSIALRLPTPQQPLRADGVIE